MVSQQIVMKKATKMKDIKKNLESESNDATTQASLSSSSMILGNDHDDDDDVEDDANRKHQRNRRGNYQDTLPQHQDQTYEIPTTNDIPRLYNQNSDHDDSYTTTTATPTPTIATPGFPNVDTTTHQHHYQARPNSIRLDTELANHNNDNPHYYKYTSWISSIILGIALLLYVKRKNNPPISFPRPKQSNHVGPQSDDHDDDFYNEDKIKESTTFSMLRSLIQTSLVYTWMERIYDEIIYGLSYVFMQYQMIVEYIHRYSTTTSGNTNRYWLWQASDNSTNQVLRQQRMEYYNSSSDRNKSGGGKYYHSMRPSKLPDLVEGILEMDDNSDHSTSDTTAVPIHNVESTRTNMAIHINPAMDPSLDGRQSEHLISEPTSNIASRSWDYNYHDLEPAFVNEMDYPSNWMVYHPFQQRVILKVHADAYNQKLMMMIREQQLSNNTNKYNVATTSTTTDNTANTTKPNEISASTRDTGAEDTVNQTAFRQSVMAT